MLDEPDWVSPVNRLKLLSASRYLDFQALRQLDFEVLD